MLLHILAKLEYAEFSKKNASERISKITPLMTETKFMTSTRIDRLLLLLLMMMMMVEVVVATVANISMILLQVSWVSETTAAY